MKNKRIIKIIFLVVALVFFAIIGWVLGMPMVSLASEPERFRLWVAKSGFLGELGYIGMLIFQIIFAIIPGEPFEIVAGYAFGMVKGTVLCLVGSTLGSVAVFILVRIFGKRIVELFFSLDRISHHHRYRRHYLVFQAKMHCSSSSFLNRLVRTIILVDFFD